MFGYTEGPGVIEFDYSIFLSSVIWFEPRMFSVSLYLISGMALPPLSPTVDKYLVVPDNLGQFDKVLGIFG